MAAIKLPELIEVSTASRHKTIALKSNENSLQQYDHIDPAFPRLTKGGTGAWYAAGRFFEIPLPYISFRGS